jgi:transposase-like protein
MPKGRKVRPEEAIRFVREVELVIAAGRTAQEACREVGVSAKAYYRWRNLYAGKTVAEAVDAYELKRENARLKRLVADQALDIQMLKEVLRGKP